MDIVGMKWNIYTSTIYYKRLQVTFTATLSRPGSDTKKVLKVNSCRDTLMTARKYITK